MGGRNTIELKRETESVQLTFNVWLVFYLDKAAQEIRTDLWRLKGKGLVKGLYA